jgi:hypothetical protein
MKEGCFLESREVMGTLKREFKAVLERSLASKRGKKKSALIKKTIERCEEQDGLNCIKDLDISNPFGAYRVLVNVC